MAAERREVVAVSWCFCAFNRSSPPEENLESVLLGDLVLVCCCVVWLSGMLGLECSNCQLLPTSTELAAGAGLVVAACQLRGIFLGQFLMPEFCGVM